MSKILIVDDYEESVALIKTFFIGTKHSFISANTGQEGYNLALAENPDLILLDVVMPGMDGFEVLDLLKQNTKTKNIPVIMVTGMEDNRSRSLCYNLGTEYISKPFNIYDIKMRVGKMLELHSYKNQLNAAEKLIYQLALIAETKDEYAQGTTRKLAGYGTYFAKHLGMLEKEISEIGKGALLHSIGKIKINDRILSKPGPLTDDEFEQIKTYPEIGESICKPIDSLKGVLPIIRNHKELYDGSGYPDKLAGESIPYNAQIIAMTDSFNALTTDRPYRKAFASQEAFEAMDQDLHKGKVNPQLYTEFKKVFSYENINEISFDVNQLTN